MHSHAKFQKPNLLPVGSEGALADVCEGKVDSILTLAKAQHFTQPEMSEFLYQFNLSESQCEQEYRSRDEVPSSSSEIKVITLVKFAKIQGLTLTEVNLSFLRYLNLDDKPSLPITSTPSLSVINSAAEVSSFDLQKKLLPSKVSNRFESLSIQQCLNSDLIGTLISNKVRKINVTGTGLKGLKLELSKSNLSLIVKSSYKGKGFRCVLKQWSSANVPKLELLLTAITDYKSIKDKLGKPPSCNDFRIYSKDFETVGDVIKVYLDKIIEQYGINSNEMKTMKGLIKNHLSQSQVVKLSNGIEQISLLDEGIQDFTLARFNAYLDVFAKTNGIHDKIVSRIKAAFNFALDQKYISAEDARAFVRTKRIAKERHVVISDDDFNQIMTKVKASEDKDFIFFMLLQSLGHFRTQQVMSTTFEQFDFQHHKVTVKPKKGKLVEIQISKDIIELVKARRDYLTDTDGSADYLFPSSSAKSGHQSNFYLQWDKICDELGFSTKCKLGKKINKYRFHDFRETLLDRVSEYDDQVLASLLGHLSTHCIKSYRSATQAKSRAASDTGYQRMQKVYM